MCPFIPPVTVPRSILVVDDEENTRFGLRLLLQADGHDVCTAGHGREAMTLFRQQPFDLVLSDVHMPQMNGIDFLRELWQDFPHVPVIMMSAAGNEQLFGDLHGAGVFACLNKPVQIDELRSVIGRLAGHGAGGCTR